MSDELKTVIGQMNIVRGRWASKAPNILAVREPSGRLRGGLSKGDLFVLIELRGDCEESKRDELSHLLAETIRDTYYQSSGSITAGLRHALLAANERLLAEPSPGRASRWDRGFDPHLGKDGLLAGVTVAAVRGKDVFMATVGPAAAYAIVGGTATQFPATSPWLDTIDPQASGASALGRPGMLDIQLFHTQVAPGDLLVLSDSRFARQSSSAEVEKAIAYQGVEDALSRLGRLTGGHECTALVVEIQAQSKAFPRTEAAVGASHAARPRTDQEGVASAAAVATAPSRRIILPKLHLALGRWLSVLGKGLLALVVVISTGLRTLLSLVLPGREREAVGRRSMETGRASPQPQRILRAVALVIPIVVLLAVLLVYWQRGLARENEFNSLMEQAQNTYQQALNASDTSSRELLAQTEALLAQAAAIKPGEPTIGELRSSIAERQDKVNHVERLYWVGELRTYDDPGANLRRVIVSGLDVYVIDTGNDQVYRHKLDSASDALEPDEGDPVLVRRGQQVGSSVAGEMIDMTWMTAGGNRQTSDLLILESGGLLEYNPSWGLDSVSIGSKDLWALPTAVGSFFGNFYILDPPAGKILRYLPTTEDYSSPAENYFPDQASVDLNGAVDLAIDGSVYVLYADGRLRKFEGGLPVEFQVTELDKPLERATAIFTAPDELTRYLYVADAGNRRVVQLNKDGRFMRQFKPRDEEAVDFSTLRSIFVDELTGKLYLLNDHSLYVANITPVE